MGSRIVSPETFPEKSRPETFPEKPESGILKGKKKDIKEYFQV